MTSSADTWQARLHWWGTAWAQPLVPGSQCVPPWLRHWNYGGTCVVCCNSWFSVLLHYHSYQNGQIISFLWLTMGAYQSRCSSSWATRSLVPRLLPPLPPPNATWSHSQAKSDSSNWSWNEVIHRMSHAKGAFTAWTFSSQELFQFLWTPSYKHKT